MLKHILNETSKLVARVSALAVLVAAFVAFSATTSVAQSSKNGKANPLSVKAQATNGIVGQDLGTWTKDESMTALSTWLANNTVGLDGAPVQKRYQASLYKLVLGELQYDIAVELSLITNFEKAKSDLGAAGSGLTLAQMQAVYNTTITSILP